MRGRHSGRSKGWAVPGQVIPCRHIARRTPPEELVRCWGLESYLNGHLKQRHQSSKHVSECWKTGMFGARVWPWPLGKHFLVQQWHHDGHLTRTVETVVCVILDGCLMWLILGLSEKKNASNSNGLSHWDGNFGVCLIFRHTQITCIVGCITGWKKITCFSLSHRPVLISTQNCRLISPKKCKWNLVSLVP